MNRVSDDKEFSEMMAEIDKLEDEFNSHSEEDFSQNEPIVQHDENIMRQLVETPTQRVEPRNIEKIHQSESKKDKSLKKENAMSFHIEGDMKLNLNFCFAGKSVDLHITDEGFEIEVDGGMKFTIPVASETKLKKVG